MDRVVEAPVGCVLWRTFDHRGRGACARDPGRAARESTTDAFRKTPSSVTVPAASRQPGTSRVRTLRAPSRAPVAGSRSSAASASTLTAVGSVRPMVPGGCTLVPGPCVTVAGRCSSGAASATASAAATTVTLAQRSPDARFTSVDVSADSIAEAKRRADRAGLTNVEFRQADIFALPFNAESFDHVFVCFVLEHLSRPVAALAIVKQMLRLGGTITVIEGDHGSTYFYPDSPAAHAAIQCQITMQREAGGNALIGRQLYPLMVEAGFDAVRVSPRMVYVDSSRPALVDGFTRKTFTAMIEGIRESAIAVGLIEPESFDAGVQDLHRTTEADGVFCHTFFKGVGEKGRQPE